MPTVDSAVDRPSFSDAPNPGRLEKARQPRTVGQSSAGNAEMRLPLFQARGHQTGHGQAIDIGCAGLPAQTFILRSSKPVVSPASGPRIFSAKVHRFRGETRAASVSSETTSPNRNAESKRSASSVSRTSRFHRSQSSHQSQSSHGPRPFPPTPYHQTLRQLRLFALSRTASQTRCVSKASRKVGPASWPVAKPCRKSATWWTKLCS